MGASIMSTNEGWADCSTSNRGPAEAELATPLLSGSETGSSSTLSADGETPRSCAGGHTDGSEEGASDQQFLDWSYKNVELLNERNREMAEQLVELRSEAGERSSRQE